MARVEQSDHLGQETRARQGHRSDHDPADLAPLQRVQLGQTRREFGHRQPQIARHARAACGERDAAAAPFDEFLAQPDREIADRAMQ